MPEVQEDREEKKVFIFRLYIDALSCSRQSKISKKFKSLMAIDV